MDLGLTGKSVIVTAGSKGLGKAIATEFAREGARVMISSRSEESLQKAQKEIVEATGNEHVRYVVCDMKKAEDIRRLVDETVAWNGTVDELQQYRRTAGREISQYDR